MEILENGATFYNSLVNKRTSPSPQRTHLHTISSRRFETSCMYIYILWCCALLDDGISPSTYQCGVHLTCLSPTLAGNADDCVLMSMS